MQILSKGNQWERSSFLASGTCPLPWRLRRRSRVTFSLSPSLKEYAYFSNRLRLCAPEFAVFGSGEGVLISPSRPDDLFLNYSTAGVGAGELRKSKTRKIL